MATPKFETPQPPKKPEPSKTPKPTSSPTKSSTDYYDSAKKKTTAKTQSSSSSKGGIAWQDAYQTPHGFQKGTTLSKSKAKAALTAGTLTKYQQDLVDQGYAAYRAAGGSKKKAGWFNLYIDGADETTSPFALIAGNMGATDAPNVNTPSGGGSGSGSYGGTQVNISMYSQDVANNIIDAAILSTYGRKATKAERESFYKQYSAAARKGTVTKTYRKNGKYYSENVSSFDEQGFQDKYVAGILQAAISKNQNVDLGGEAGKLQDSLRKYSSEMGLMMSEKEINRNVLDVYNKKTTADDAAAKMRKQATVLYSNFADRLNADPTLTVRDIANPYIQLMADTFEIADPNSIKLTDGTVQGFLSNKDLPSIGDAYKQLRQDSRYRNTTKAVREASDLATGFASAMGF